MSDWCGTIKILSHNMRKTCNVFLYKRARGYDKCLYGFFLINKNTYLEKEYPSSRSYFIESTYHLDK